MAQLRAVKALASKQRWSEVLEITRDPEVLDAEPRLLTWRVMAAANTGSSDIVASTAEQGATANLSGAQGFALVRDIAAAGYLSPAIKLLLSRADLREHPRFAVAAARLAKITRDRTEKAALRQVIAAASKGGVDIEPLASDFAFPAEVGDPTAFGRVQIARSSVTQDGHQASLAEATQRFGLTIHKRKPPRVREYRDVFVNRMGQIWTEDGAIIKSAGTKVTAFDRSAVETLDTALYMLRGTRGIYHWLVDYLPLMSSIMGDASIPILISDGAPKFEVDTLRLAGIDPARAIGVGDAVFVRRLLVASSGMPNLLEWSRFRNVVDPIVQSALSIAAAEGVVLSPRIYISRRAAARRVMTNESDVEALAVGQGFEILAFEKMPLWHQIAAVQHATTIMAPHGAGLSHLLLAPSGRKVLELVPIQRGDRIYFLRWNYARLSMVRGHHYQAWLEEQAAGFDPWEVRLGEFEPFFAQWLAQ